MPPRLDGSRTGPADPHGPPNSMAPAEAIARIEATKWAVTSRMVPDVDQSTAISPLPAELEPYVAQLQAAGGPVALMMANGWTVAMVDIRRVTACQPIVYTDGVDRVSGVDTTDLHALAQFALPAAPNSTMNMSFDQAGRSWLITSEDPNLGILGIPAPDPAAPMFGYAIGATASLIQIVRRNGRLLLRDGYHRSVGLLTRGVYKVPAMVLDHQLSEQLIPFLPQGMLPSTAYLGDRPPTLADYFDEAVACTVATVRTRKAVVVTATVLDLPY